MRRGSVGLALRSTVLATVLLAACRVPVTVTITWQASTPAAAIQDPASDRTPAPASPTPATEPDAGGAGSTAGSALFFRLRTAPPAELEIPRIGIDVPVRPVASVIEGDRWQWLVPSDAAGHLLGSANPGEPGNIAITGHVDTRYGPGIFARLAELRPGDRVVVRTADGEFVYHVVETFVVSESDVTILRQTQSELLTLITCVPDGEYAHRLVVRARRDEAPTI